MLPLILILIKPGAARRSAAPGVLISLRTASRALCDTPIAYKVCAQSPVGRIRLVQAVKEPGVKQLLKSVAAS